MKDVRSLTAEELLAIPADEPERIYPNSADKIKQRFRLLAARWHPDRASEPRAADVFAHIKSLRETAEQKVASGTWSEPQTLTFKGLDGRDFKLRYLHKSAFELGMMYIGQSHVTYVIDKPYADLAQRAARTIRDLKYFDPKMQTEMARNLPTIKSSFETAVASVLVLEKDPDLIRLRDVLDSTGGKIDPKQVAWMLSHLYNTACYLRWAKLSHNDLSPETIFVSPQHHGGAVLGGWWYATGFGNKLAALPTRSVELAPSDVLRTHKADARVDLELIRAIGRELLGDPSGSGLSWNKEVPKPLADWLRSPTSGDALKDYKSYKDHVLPGSFGARRFVKWDISSTDIYKVRSM